MESTGVPSEGLGDAVRKRTRTDTVSAGSENEENEDAPMRRESLKPTQKLKTSIVADTVVPISVPAPDSIVGNQPMKHFPQCSSTEGVRTSSYFCNKVGNGESSGGPTRTQCLRKLLQELVSLEDALPTNPAIFVRFDEETPQFIRALVTAPSGTPYANGLFAFDIFCPNTYPASPPKVQLLTTGNGTMRFSPNLYADGKVCLSLLNTWDGPKWNPHHSTLLQVFVSIQGLILGCEHPYYLEPGHGGWGEKTHQITQSDAGVPSYVTQFEDKLRIGTVKFAMLDMLQQHTSAIASSKGVDPPRSHYLRPFFDIIASHFYHFKDSIALETAGWATTMKLKSQRGQFKQLVTQLSEELGKLPKPSCVEEFTTVSTSKVATVSGDKRKAQAAATTDSMIARKRRAMEDAVAKMEYVRAGRLQTELHHLENKFCNDSVEAKIASKRRSMEKAASEKDYISAGQIQASLLHLEQNKKLLKDLEGRMFEAASKLNFVRAGRFQEQYDILLTCSDDKPSSAARPVPTTQVTSPPLAPLAHTTSKLPPPSSFLQGLAKGIVGSEGKIAMEVKPSLELGDLFGVWEDYSEDEMGFGEF